MLSYLKATSLGVLVSFLTSLSLIFGSEASEKSARNYSPFFYHCNNGQTVVRRADYQSTKGTMSPFIPFPLRSSHRCYGDVLPGLLRVATRFATSFQITVRSTTAIRGGDLMAMSSESLIRRLCDGMPSGSTLWRRTDSSARADTLSSCGSRTS